MQVTKHSNALPRLDGGILGRALSRSSIRSLSTLSDSSSSLCIASSCCCSAAVGSGTDFWPSEASARNAHDREQRSLLQ